MNIQTPPAAPADLRRTPAPVRLDKGLERLADFARDLRQVETALGTLSDLLGQNTTKTLERHRKELAEFEPTLTVLGQVKAGKTALVNAMAGWSDLLPSDVNPWTSVVTSLHLRHRMDAGETAARFRFLTDGEWDRLLSKGGRMGELSSRAGAESELQKIAQQIEMVREKARKRLGRKFELLIGQEHDYGYFDKNLLEKYICIGDDFLEDDADPEALDQGRFAEILRSADLYLNSGHVPCNLCLRDTPGVNDTFMMREQITVQAVRDSKLCLVVLSANQALTTVDMGLIRLISNLKSRDIMIFVNRIDELSAPGTQIPEIEASIRETLLQHHGPSDIEIIFGSAFWANTVLAGDIDKLPEQSGKALLNWAEATLHSSQQNARPHEIVWELSGLPGLFRTLSDRIIEDIGTPFLSKTAGAAISLATGEQAAGKVRLQANTGASLGPDELRQSLDRLSEQNMQVLRAELDKIVVEYNSRIDRAHGQFIERATQSLISHLEQFGPRAGWRYDPTGLRLLVRSAYSVFGKRVQALASQHYETALVDIAELYARTFGDAVAGMQLALPKIPDIPPPVALGQTIALDFNDGWWVSWWQRLRGYDVFAKQFRQLIAGETEDFMLQLKSVQTDEVCHQITDTLATFMADQQTILGDILAGAADPEALRDLLSPEAERKREARFDQVLHALHPFTTDKEET